LSKDVRNPQGISKYHRLIRIWTPQATKSSHQFPCQSQNRPRSGPHLAPPRPLRTPVTGCAHQTRAIPPPSLYTEPEPDPVFNVIEGTNGGDRSNGTDGAEAIIGGSSYELMEAWSSPDTALSRCPPPREPATLPFSCISAPSRLRVFWSRSGQPPVKRERGATPRLPPQLLAASVFGTCHWETGKARTAR